MLTPSNAVAIDRRLPFLLPYSAGGLVTAVNWCSERVIGGFVLFSQRRGALAAAKAGKAGA